MNQTNDTHRKKKWFTLSNLFTLILVAFIALITFNPNAKAWVIFNLMKIGLFQPDVSTNATPSHTSMPPELARVTLTVSNGNIISMSELQGKVVFINFWAVWCPPCIAEMHSINKLYKDLSAYNDVAFLLIDVDGDLKKSNDFMKRNNYELPVYSMQQNFPENYFGGTLPTTVILDKSGNIVFKHTGASDFSNPKMYSLMESLRK